MIEECFIKNLNIRVLSGVKGKLYYGSYFMPKEKEITLAKNGKLENVTFTIGIDDNDIKTNKSRNQFFQRLAHEIHHAFKYYNICNSNNSAKENEQKIRDRYRNTTSMFMKGSDNKIERRIVLASYTMNKNEIMSECNRLYEYIRQHEEINSKNFRDYLDEMPLYFVINQADRNIEEVDTYLFSKDINKINYVGEVWKKINNIDNISSEKAFLKYRFDLISKRFFVSRVFYRTLNKAFDDFNRKNTIPNVIEMIETNKDYELLREILNRH